MTQTPSLLPLLLTVVLTLVAAAAAVTLVVAATALLRWIGRDGYGGPPPPAGTDWGSPALPARPYARR